jgi:hypothetical protein
MEATAAEPDWLAACRRIVAELRAMLGAPDAPRERAVELGPRRGRRPHAGDRRGRRGADLRRAGARARAGHGFTAISEERGEVALRRRRCASSIDPIDGSMNAKRGLWPHACRSPSPTARRWPTSASASSTTSASARSGPRARRRSPAQRRGAERAGAASGAPRGACSSSSRSSRRTPSGSPRAAGARPDRPPPARVRLDRLRALPARGGSRRRHGDARSSRSVDVAAGS